MPDNTELVGTERSNTSPVISTRALALHARETTGFLHGWRRSVTAGGVVAGVGIIAGSLWPNASGVTAWLVGTGVSAVAAAILVSGEWLHRRYHARSDILTHRLQNANDDRHKLERTNAALLLALAASKEQPEIQVHLVRSREGYQVRVTNPGAAATFYANLRIAAITGGSYLDTRHRMWWQRALGVASEIATNGDDAFTIGQVFYDGLWNISLWSFSESERRCQSFWHQGYVPGNNHPPVALLEITITSQSERVRPWTRYVRVGPTDVDYADLAFPLDRTAAQIWLAREVAEEEEAGRAFLQEQAMPRAPDTEPRPSSVA